MASGFLRRMGKDKLLIKIKDKYIIDYVLETMYESNFYENIVVVRKNEIIKKAKNGISESIKLGVKYSSKDTLGYMFFQGYRILITIHDIKK